MDEEKPTVKKIPWSLEDYRIRLISWNICGLEEEDLRSRTLAEVIQETEEIVRMMCSTYEVVPASNSSYYTAILLRKDVTEMEKTTIVPFPNTTMERNLLMVECAIKGEKFSLMTTHLESTRECRDERLNQLKMAFALMTTADPCQNVVFGGDLNLRGKEVDIAGGLPDNVYDIWEITGSRPEAKFSWNCQINDNLDWIDNIKDISKRPKIRFDRLYIRYSSPQVVKPEFFELIGQKRLPVCECFCSDHWGLLTHFNILAKVPK